MINHHSLLKDRAIAAYKEQQGYKAEKETARFAKRAKATETDFQKRFGEHVPIKPGTCDVILAKDGLELRAVFNNYGNVISSFGLRGTCPDCGADCYSRPIYDLEDLGKQIESFKSGWPHKCPPTARCITTGEMLLEAFQKFFCELEETPGA